MRNHALTGALVAKHCEYYQATTSRDSNFKKTNFLCFLTAIRTHSLAFEVFDTTLTLVFAAAATAALLFIVVVVVAVDAFRSLIDIDDIDGVDAGRSSSTSK